ncbi:hypothetical protein FN846DRAFT_201880 [Sphaerosporella brunnea]|uniref:Uncharacterized protein n=1 Tax=Sphaerosporella brunnea TaxID=1250544 RepID=A0A5J5F843_9PEZI|nr:hypothetical protein FN846DRAFT_201880 [Sphaerosporella brunnea]
MSQTHDKDRSSLKSSSSALSGIKRLLSKKEKNSHTSPPIVAPSTPDSMPSVKQLTNGNGAVTTKGKGGNGKDPKANGFNGTKTEGLPAEKLTTFVNAFLEALQDAPIILPEIEALVKVRGENEELKEKLSEKERELIEQLDEKDKDLEKKEKELQAVIDSKDALLEKEGKQWMEAIKKELSTESVSAALLKEKEKEMEALVALHKSELEKSSKKHQEEAQRKEMEAAMKLNATKKDLERQLELAKKETVTALKERDEYKAKLDDLNAQLGQTKTLLAAEELHRQRREEELTKIQHDMGLRELVEPQFEKQASELEAKFHALAKATFYDLVIPFNPTDEYNEGLKRELVNSGFVSRKEATGDFPLMLSNTAWSRAIVMALAENIIATQITDSIFRMVPLPYDTLGSKKTTDYLEIVSNSLLASNPENEARWRSLSSIAMEAEPTAQDRRNVLIDTILDRLAGIFDPLFRHEPEALERLLNTLAELLVEASDFWSLAQHSKLRVVAEMAMDLEPGECDCHPEHNDIPVPDDELKLDETGGPLPLPLFPRFSVLDADGLHTIFDGKALPPTAHSAIRSRAESKKYKRTQSEKLRASMSSGASTASRPNGGRRRQSVSTNQGSSSASGGQRSPTFSARTPVMARPPGYVAGGGASVGGVPVSTGVSSGQQSGASSENGM